MAVELSQLLTLFYKYKKSFLYISFGNMLIAVPYKGPSYAIISRFVFDRNLTFSESYEVFRKYYA